MFSITLCNKTNNNEKIQKIMKVKLEKEDTFIGFLD